MEKRILCCTRDFTVYFGIVIFPRWERPAASGIGGIIDNPPQCLLDELEDPTAVSMHVYVREWDPVTVNCIFNRHPIPN